MFDIKEIITLFVDALNRTGPRSVIAWDDNLLASLRLKNRLLQSQSAVRADLNVLIRELAVMKRYQEEFELLRPEEEVADALADMSVLASSAHCSIDAYEDVLNVCKVGEAPGGSWPTRLCKKGLHQVATNIDFCGDCGEFFDDFLVCPICSSPFRKQPDFEADGRTRQWVCRGYLT